MPKMVDREMVRSWTEEFDAVNGRIAARFARSEPRERARSYLRGLLRGIERKNGFYEKGILVKSRRGGGDCPPRTSTTAPLRLLLSAFALGQLSSRPDA